MNVVSLEAIAAAKRCGRQDAEEGNFFPEQFGAGSMQEYYAEAFLKVDPANESAVAWMRPYVEWSEGWNILRQGGRLCDCKTQSMLAGYKCAAAEYANDAAQAAWHEARELQDSRHEMDRAMHQ